MTGTKKVDAADHTWVKALAFAFSLVVGLAGGFGLLVGGWVLANSATGATIADALAITAKTPWYFSRSAGTVAYVLLAGSTIWGLLLSTKVIKESVPAAVTLAIHNILSWLAVLFTGMHALALLWDSYYSYSLADLTVPFVGPYRPGWVGLGIIGFYLMFITSISFEFRKQIGQKHWRQLHYATFAVYVLATVHGAMAGTDSGNAGMQALYWGSGIVVLLLTTFRLKMRQAVGLGITVLAIVVLMLPLGNTYLQVVKSSKTATAVHQQVVETLGSSSPVVVEHIDVNGAQVTIDLSDVNDAPSATQFEADLVDELGQNVNVELR